MARARQRYGKSAHRELWSFVNADHKLDDYGLWATKLPLRNLPAGRAILDEKTLGSADSCSGGVWPMPRPNEGRSQCFLGDKPSITT